MQFAVTTRIDATGLNRGIEAALRTTKRTVPMVINSAALHVAYGAMKRTPFVTAETVDAELGKVVTPVIGRSGKELKGKFTLSSGRTISVARVSYTTAPTGKKMWKFHGRHDVPIAALIIQVMSRTPGVKQLAKGFPLMKSPFADLPRTLGRQKMRAYVDKLIKSRRKSVHFLASGWREAIEELRKLVRGVFGGTPIGEVRRYGGKGLGQAIPAKEGLEAFALIENNIGAEGDDRVRTNNALLVHAGPALQTAIDAEGKSQMEHALKKMEQEIARETNHHWK